VNRSVWKRGKVGGEKGGGAISNTCKNRKRRKADKDEHPVDIYIEKTRMNIALTANQEELQSVVQSDRLVPPSQGDPMYQLQSDS